MSAFSSMQSGNNPVTLYSCVEAEKEAGVVMQDYNLVATVIFESGVAVDRVVADVSYRWCMSLLEKSLFPSDNSVKVNTANNTNVGIQSVNSRKIKSRAFS